MTEFIEHLEVASAAVREAAELCQRVQSKIQPQVLEKKDRSPVTVADFGSQALICKALHEAFPEIPIVAEEDSASLQREENRHLLSRLSEELEHHVNNFSPQDIFRWIDLGTRTVDSELFWTLDPIDGTKGFLRGEQYAISLALLNAGKIEIAVLACPNLPFQSSQIGTLMTARHGEGAFQRPLFEDGKPVRVYVNRVRSLHESRFCESVESGHSSHSDSQRLAQYLGISAEPVRLDSQAKYGVVARGEAEIYLRLPTRKDYHEKIWDHAGGALIVQEAGGIVTDIFGEELDFSCGHELLNNKGVIVSNGLFHSRILDGLKQLGIT